MSNYVANFEKYRPLLMELTTRDIKTRYRKSMLGVLWSLLNPLLQMVVLSVVFSHLFRSGIENFPLYIMSGQVIYNFFSEATNSAMGAIIGSASLIKKAYIPKYLFVLSRILSSAVNVMATFAAYIVVMLVTGAEFHITIILSFIPIIFTMLFCVGVGMILAAFAVKFRDILHLYGVFIMALMYLTPIIYPMSMLPQGIRRIVLANPLTNLVVMFRNVALDGILPSLGSILLAAAECAIVIVLGALAFVKRQDKFIFDL